MELSRRLRQRRRPLLIVVGTLVLALVLEAGFYLGQHAAYRGMGAKPRSYQAMQAQLLELENSLRERNAELAIQRTRHEVDRQALELVRKELAGQKEEMAGLEEGLAFYRSLMSPGEIAPGLSLRGIELKADEEPGTYSYRIVVQQEARKHELLKGSLSATLKGLQDGAPAEHSLAELSEDFGADSVPLQFRYFQSISGHMVLPEGFEPQTIEVQASTLKPHAHEVREQYPWQLEERFTHVGK